MTSPTAAGGSGSDHSSPNSPDRDPNGGVANPGLPVIIGPGTGVSGGIPGGNAVNTGTAAASAATNANPNAAAPNNNNGNGNMNRGNTGNGAGNNSIANPAATNTGATGTAPGARSTDSNSNTTNPNAVPARGSNATQPPAGGANTAPGGPASSEINRRTPAAGQNNGAGTGTNNGRLAQPVEPPVPARARVQAVQDDKGHPRNVAPPPVQRLPEKRVWVFQSEQEQLTCEIHELENLPSVCRRGSRCEFGCRRGGGIDLPRRAGPFVSPCPERGGGSSSRSDGGHFADRSTP